MNFDFSQRMKNIDSDAVADIFKSASDPSFISLAGGYPESSLFPYRELSIIAKNEIEKTPVETLQYRTTNGDSEFMDVIRDRMKRIENITCSHDEIIITSGSTQAIELIGTAFINKGDTVIVESPSFMGALNAFRTFDANLVGIETDEYGMNLEKLEKTLKEEKNIKFIYVIPTFQNPKGIIWSVERRKAFYELVKKYGIPVLEDNPYGDLAFDGSKTPTLKSMDTENLVMYCGSFSKILCPGLRIGYCIAHRDVINQISAAKQVSDLHTPFLNQIVIREYMKNNDIEKLIAQMRACYKSKCDVMIGAMDEFFPEEIEFTRPKGGLFTWVNVGHGVDTLELAQRAKEKKVCFVPGCSFMCDIKEKNSMLRLNYSTMEDEKSIEGIRRLSLIIKEALGIIH